MLSFTYFKHTLYSSQTFALFASIFALTLAMGCTSSGNDASDPEKDGSVSDDEDAGDDDAGHDSGTNPGAQDGGIPDAGDDAGAEDGGTATGCAATIAELFAWDLGGKQILVSSNAETVCSYPTGACYEGLMIFEDGSVLYQKLTLADDLIACENLQPLTVAQLNDLNTDVNNIQHGGSFLDQSSLVTCNPSSSASPDYGVDNYRAAVSLTTPLLPMVLDNLSCQGYQSSAPIKTILDDYWEIAPR